MSIRSEETLRNTILYDIACQMMIAARTAPKAKGRDTLSIALAEGDTLEQLAQKMEEIGERENASFFIRDANNIRQAAVVVFIGTCISVTNLPACGYCGFNDCSTKNQYQEAPCAFNSVDLGIAIGSAVSTAAIFKADNRVMFSVGKAALELGLMDKDVKLLYGIPLTATSKSPFFDRK